MCWVSQQRIIGPVQLAPPAMWQYHTYCGGGVVSIVVQPNRLKINSAWPDRSMVKNSLLDTRIRVSK
jgi:hypothetical protein